MGQHRGCYLTQPEPPLLCIYSASTVYISVSTLYLLSFYSVSTLFQLGIPSLYAHCIYSVICIYSVYLFLLCISLYLLCIPSVTLCILYYNLYLLCLAECSVALNQR